MSALAVSIVTFAPCGTSTSSSALWPRPKIPRPNFSVWRSSRWSSPVSIVNRSARDRSSSERTRAVSPSPPRIGDLARGKLEHEAAARADALFEGRAGPLGGLGHLSALPRARMAVAASSALISCPASRSRIFWRSAVASARVRGLVVGRLIAVPRSEAERADERLDPRPDGRVRDPELALHVPEVAPRPEEALQQDELLARQPAEAPDAELALQGRAARAAVEAGDGELPGADGTGGDDVVRHAVPFVCRRTIACTLSLCQCAVATL